MATFFLYSFTKSYAKMCVINYLSIENKYIFHSNFSCTYICHSKLKSTYTMCSMIYSTNTYKHCSLVLNVMSTCFLDVLKIDYLAYIISRNKYGHTSTLHLTSSVYNWLKSYSKLTQNALYILNIVCRVFVGVCLFELMIAFCTIII